MLIEMSLVALLATPETKPQPVDWEKRVDSAVKKEAEENPKPAPETAAPKAAPAKFLEGTLYQDITVTDWYNEFLILPAYELARPPVKTLKGFGVPRGGNGGSPGFDPVTRKYWWE